MITEPNIKPMSRSLRRLTFLTLCTVFICAIPFLFLFATGYRLDFSGTGNLISTGGVFIAVEQEEVEAYIDDELVPARRFRSAFYAHSIEPGTHRVHVQKEGHHTWVKELPVYPHLVTEVQAFNLPLRPQARIITRFETATGTPVVFGLDALPASTTEPVRRATSTATSTYVVNPEFAEKAASFGLALKATTTTQAGRVLNKIEEAATNIVRGEATSTKDVATTTDEKATTTKEYGGVRLFERDQDVYALWVGSRENMPYYYCAESFPRLEIKEISGVEKKPALETILVKESKESKEAEKKDIESGPVVQEVPADSECVPEIRIDRKWQKVQYFDFFPGSTDLLVVVLDDGVYAVEIDDRSWQNMQPIMQGRGLSARIDNGHVVVYDGAQFYEMLFELPQ